MPRLDPSSFGLETLPGTGEVWLTATWQAERAGELLDPPIGLACSPDGTLVATVGPNARCSLWERATGALVRRIEDAGRVGAVAFHPDGRHLFLGRHDSATVVQVEATTGTTVATWRVGDALPAFAGRDAFVRAVQVDATGARLAVEVWAFTDRYPENFDTDQALVVWDVAREAAAWTLEPPTVDAFAGFRFAPDGAALEVVRPPALVRLDAGTGAEVARETGTPAAARGAVVAPDGRTALVPILDAAYQIVGCEIVVLPDGVAHGTVRRQAAGQTLSAIAPVPGSNAFALALADGRVATGSWS